MVQKGLTGFFEKFLTKENIFLNKKVMLTSYQPDTILHRDEQIHLLANVLAPALRSERTSNVFIYGKSGTGKTVSVRYTLEKMNEVATEKSIMLKIIYVNCKLKKTADTEYRLIAQLARELGHDIPPTGLPTEEVYKIFFKAIDHEQKNFILVLDEIDQLVKKTGDEVLYNLTRINEELQHSQITLIGISNDLQFIDNIDQRVKSSLSEEELLFHPYNALQLQDILNQRSKKAFREGALDQGVIEKCAAYAAREHGDARRAIDLLRVAAEIAERKGLPAVAIAHIDEAEEKIERDRILDIVQSQPKQQQATLLSILLLHQKRKNAMLTGEIYEVYKSTCLQSNLRPLTQRRISDIIGELDMMGIITAKVKSLGRYGRTREISLATLPESNEKIKKIIEESLNL